MTKIRKNKLIFWGGWWIFEVWNSDKMTGTFGILKLEFVDVLVLEWSVPEPYHVPHVFPLSSNTNLS